MALLTRNQLEQKRARAYTTKTVPHPDAAKAAAGETVEIRLRAMFGGEWIDLIRSFTKADGTSTPMNAPEEDTRSLMSASRATDRPSSPIGTVKARSRSRSTH